MTSRMIDKKTLSKMVRLALSARDNAYAPSSNHPVGCSVLTASGKFYAGCNCELANYDITCAENAALAAMVTDGERVIRAILTVGPSSKYLCTPCGRCRQRIREFCDSKTVIYAMKEDGSFGKSFTMEELLPFSFGPEHLRALQKKKKKKSKK